MASIRKFDDKRRARVFRNGKRASKVLRTKREAQEWASRQEYLIEAGDGRPRPSFALAEAGARAELLISNWLLDSVKTAR